MKILRPAHDCRKADTLRVEAAEGNADIRIVFRGLPHGFADACACYPCLAARQVTQAALPIIQKRVASTYIIQVSCHPREPETGFFLYPCGELEEVPEHNARSFDDSTDALAAALSLPRAVLVCSALWGRRAVTCQKLGDRRSELIFSFLYLLDVQIVDKAELVTSYAREMILSPDLPGEIVDMNVKHVCSSTQVLDFTKTFYSMPEADFQPGTTLLFDAHPNSSLQILRSASHAQGNALWTIRSDDVVVEVHVKILLCEEECLTWDDRHARIWSEFLKQRKDRLGGGLSLSVLQHYGWQLVHHVFSSTTGILTLRLRYPHSPVQADLRTLDLWTLAPLTHEAILQRSYRESVLRNFGRRKLQCQLIEAFNTPSPRIISVRLSATFLYRNDGPESLQGVSGAADVGGVVKGMKESAMSVHDGLHACNSFARDTCLLLLAGA